MKTRIQKWGNSLALRIPRALAEDANVRDGSTVEVRLEDGRLVLEADVEPHYELAALLAEVPVLVPLDELAAEGKGPQDLYIFALVLEEPAPAGQGVERPLCFIQPMPTSWARPLCWQPLLGLTIKSGC